jgi:hypothetical protein
VRQGAATGAGADDDKRGSLGIDGHERLLMAGRQANASFLKKDAKNF